MHNIASSPAPWLTDTVRWWCYRLTNTFKRVQRAFQYATAHLSADNAQHIMIDCCYDAGWHPLLILDVQETLNEAREIFTDHPTLPRLIAAACSRVARKWEGDGTDSHEPAAGLSSSPKTTRRKPISNSSAGPTFCLPNNRRLESRFSQSPRSHPSNPPTPRTPDNGQTAHP